MKFHKGPAEPRVRKVKSVEALQGHPPEVLPIQLERYVNDSHFEWLSEALTREKQERPPIDFLYTLAYMFVLYPDRIRSWMAEYLTVDDKQAIEALLKEDKAKGDWGAFLIDAESVKQSIPELLPKLLTPEVQTNCINLFKANRQSKKWSGFLYWASIIKQIFPTAKIDLDLSPSEWQEVESKIAEIRYEAFEGEEYGPTAFFDILINYKLLFPSRWEETKLTSREWEVIQEEVKRYFEDETFMQMNAHLLANLKIFLGDARLTADGVIEVNKRASANPVRAPLPDRPGV